MMDEVRFWSKVNFEGAGGCWEWLAALDRKGYGRVRLFNVDRIASRAAWALVNGEPPSALHVCHRCDNRRCVNPAHLFLGTAKENSQDASRKGRMHPGSRSGASKLTAADVLAIRERCAAGEMQKVVAKSFGIRQQQVSKLVRRQQWPWLQADGSSHFGVRIVVRALTSAPQPLT